MMRLAAVLLLALLAGTADAQSPPYTYAYSVGVTAMQVLPQNTGRRRVNFINTSTSALIAVCPAAATRSPPYQPVVPTSVHTAGCMVVLPGADAVVDFGFEGGPVLYAPAAWNAIASAPDTPLTIIERE
jgi:hypothetical protein